MAIFEITKKWTILAPASSVVIWSAADELAAYISRLQDRAGCGQERPLIADAETVSPPEYTPLILLSAADADRDNDGFTWRLGKNRIEIRGDSDRGLWNGVFDFLAAVGIRWPQPGLEELPSASATGVFPLHRDHVSHPATPSALERRRLLIDGNKTAREREALVRWAARNKYDALVFSIGEQPLWNRLRRHKGLYHLLEHYALIIEAGGHDLSALLPRRLFFLHRKLFRMDSGVRSKLHHFCPTNPETITRITAQAAKLFSRALAGMSAGAARVFHLWPDSGSERTWCACPACRAFTPTEQNRIAINTAAAVLERLDPAARLSYFEDAEETKTLAAARDTPGGGGIVPRSNTFVLSGG